MDYKLTWINPQNFEVLESDFYTTLSEAVQASENKENWLIFKRLDQQGSYYKWLLLPYGKQRMFMQIMRAQKNIALLILVSVIVLIATGFVAYKIGKNATI